MDFMSYNLIRVVHLFDFTYLRAQAGWIRILEYNRRFWDTFGSCFGALHQWAIIWMLYVSLKCESNVLKGCFWRMVSISPGVVAGLFIFSLINQHLTNEFLLSFLAAIILALPINILIAKNRFSRAVFMLSLYEISMRIFRMYFVKVAFLISPAKFLEENVKTFYGAYSCTSDLAIDLSRNASTQVTRQAISVSKSFLNSINSVTSQVGEIVSPTVNLLEGFLNVTSGFFQSFSSTKQGCTSGLASINNECEAITLEVMTCHKKYGSLMATFVCPLVPPALTACNSLQSGRLCDVFDISQDLNNEINVAQDALLSLRKEMVVDLDMNISTELTTNSFFTGIKNDFEEDMSDKLGMIWCWYQVFGALLGFKIIFVVFKKYRIVKTFRNSGSLKSEGISTFMKYTNPFVFQFIFICLNLFADVLVRIFYQMHRDQLANRPLEFGTDLFVNVILKDGGHIASLIANLLGNSLNKFEEIRILENLGRCYDQELLSPAYFHYFVSFLICYLGYISYNDTGLYKGQQKLIIDIACAEWGLTEDSIEERIRYLFPCEN